MREKRDERERAQRSEKTDETQTGESDAEKDEPKDMVRRCRTAFATLSRTPTYTCMSGSQMERDRPFVEERER